MNLLKSLYKKVNLSTFESADISDVTAKVTGKINGKEIAVEFDNADNFSSHMAGIKSLFATATSDTFLSAVMFCQDILLTKTDPKNEKKRIPLTEDEIQSLRFSYVQEKETGNDVSPEITWEDVLLKYQIAETFDMVESAQRKRRTSEKVINVAW